LQKEGSRRPFVAPQETAPAAETVVTSAATISAADIALASAATVISGGYENTNSGGGTDRGVFFSGGGTVQLDAPLSQVAGAHFGVRSRDEVDLRSQSLTPRFQTPQPERPEESSAGLRREKGGERVLLVLGTESVP
jgi:hypothetical protein